MSFDSKTNRFGYFDNMRIKIELCWGINPLELEGDVGGESAEHTFFDL